MELAPRFIMLRNVGIVKPQSSFLEYECTCGGKSAKRRVKGPKQREGSISPRRRAEAGEALKWSSRARDSVETPDWHCLQEALKRTFHIKSSIFEGQSSGIS